MFTSSPQSSNATGATTQSFEEEANALTNRILATISGSLSILGSSFIIVTYFLWKDLRSTSRKILGYISFADFCLATSALEGLWNSEMTSSDNPSCEAQSFVTTTASLWSFFWTTFLAVFLYMIAVKKRRREAEIIFKVFHVFGWGIPLVIVGIALGEEALGNDMDKVTPGWCWINTTLKDKIFWMLITGKAWEISSCILCFLFFILLILHIRKKVYHDNGQLSSTLSKETALKVQKRLILVPALFVMVRIWGTIRFLLFWRYDGSGHDSAWWEEALLYLQGMGDGLQGFTNFLLFSFFTEKFQTTLKQAFLACRRIQGPTSEASQSIVVTASEDRNVNENTYLLSH